MLTFSMLQFRGSCKLLYVRSSMNLLDCRNIKAKSQCDNWVISKYCTQTYASWMKTNCASSCGHCVCKDNNNQCASWARTGECQKNPKYMLLNCQKSCAVCRPKGTKKPGMFVGVIRHTEPVVKTRQEHI